MIYQIIINTVNIFIQIMQIFSRIIFMLIIFLSNIFHMFIHSFVPYSKIYSLFILCYETFKTLVNHHGIASDFQAWGKFQKFKCLLPWLIREQFSGHKVRECEQKWKVRDTVQLYFPYHLEV